MNATAVQSDAIRSFTLWAIDQLKLEIVHNGQVHRLDIPEAHRSRFDGQDQVSFAFTSEPTSSDVECVTPQGRLISWLIERLQAQGHFVHTRPRQQPEGVHELSGRLFPAYTIEQGSVHLGGCTLEDRPFLRLSFRLLSGELEHVYTDGEGKRLAADWIDALHLADVMPYPDRPPKLAPHQEDAILAEAHHATDDDEHLRSADLLVLAVVWCKYAQGKLCFTIGDHESELAFAGWATTLQPPEFVCPETRAASFHLAATDDGHITDVGQIQICAESGRRVLAHDLVECQVTGQHVLAEFIEMCPVLGHAVLRTEIVACAVCRQRVCRSAVTAEACQACRSLARVSKDDARLARVLGEYPTLDRWRFWKLSETETAYIAVASSLFQRHLFVIDKHTLVPLYVAAGHRFSSAFSELNATQREELLGS